MAESSSTTTFQDEITWQINTGTVVLKWSQWTRTCLFSHFPKDGYFRIVWCSIIMYNPKFNLIFS